MPRRRRGHAAQSTSNHISPKDSSPTRATTPDPVAFPSRRRRVMCEPILYKSVAQLTRRASSLRLQAIYRTPARALTMIKTELESERNTNRKALRAGINVLVALIGLLISVGPALSENASDWITGLPREPIHVQAWPQGKKVAVCFILYVEVWGFGHGPNFRPDTAARDPDVVDESFRQYAIYWGIPRVGRLFNEQALPLSIALNATYPEEHPDVWQQFRSLVPKAPIIAHGINNSTELLPLGRGLDAQKAYIQRTLDLIEKGTGVRSRGWTSPSVYPNADTFTATAAEGIGYSLDAMDSDVLSRLMRPIPTGRPRSDARVHKSNVVLQQCTAGGTPIRPHIGGLKTIEGRLRTLTAKTLGTPGSIST